MEMALHARSVNCMQKQAAMATHCVRDIAKPVPQPVALYQLVGWASYPCGIVLRLAGLIQSGAVARWTSASFLQEKVLPIADQVRPRRRPTQPGLAGAGGVLSPLKKESMTVPSSGSSISERTWI